MKWKHAKVFELSLREYVKYTTEHKTLGKDLKKYGWLID